jgi:hypothetical protein
MLKPTWFLACLLMVWVASATGQPVDLFVEQAPVENESTETRNAALSAMLERVLVRVSGNLAIAAQPAAAEVLSAAPRLVQQYRYRSVEDDGEMVRYLWARFDGAAVERMLRERNLPVWVQRPEVLLWLATEQQGQRQLVSFDRRPAAREALLARANERGLPLQLPLLDLEDQAALTPADLWADYLQAVRTASARYPHDRILTGRLTDLGKNRWRGSWSLITPTNSESFASPSMSFDATLRFAIDQVQDRLAARYAPLEGGAEGGGTQVRFSGVYDLPRYAALLDLVERLEPVRGAALRFADGEDVVFEFAVRGDPQNLLRALEASGRLAREPLPVTAPVLPVSPEADEGNNETVAETPATFVPPIDYAYRLLN